MPKFVAILVASRPMHIGLFYAFCTGLLLHPAIAATPEPQLRRSEQLDIRRLGKVSEDERAVLRIEWRVGLSGAEEAQYVRGMLDTLRRIEQTMASVGVLVRGIPMQKPVARSAEAESPPSDSFDMRLLFANLAAACLIALWWFRRRRKPGTSVSPKVTEGDGVPVLVSPVAPATSPISTAASAITPSTIVTAPTPIAAQPHPAPTTAAAGIEIERVKPGVGPESLAATAAPLAKAVPEIQFATAVRQPLASETTTAPAAPIAATVDFSLEEADPESIARAEAKQAAKTPASIPGPARPSPAEPEIELEPTLQLAEIMLSMGLEQGAAQALVDYTEANPRHSLHHWLKLLGIYRKRGLRTEFAETAERLRQNFNIQAEDWAKAGTGEIPTLENFSRVSEHVQKIWSQSEQCIDYLRHLLEDNRDGARAGFPQSVAEEILLLVDVLKLRSGIDQTAGT